MLFLIKRILFTYKIRNILIELLIYLYLQGLSSFSMKPCILIIYQNACSNSEIFSTALEKISHCGQYHNVDNILRQLYGLCRSPPSRLRHSDLIEDPLTLYELYPF